MTSLSDLNNLVVDVEVAPPELYVDNNTPDLVPEGVYNLTLEAWDGTRDRESDALDGRGFVLQFRVADGEFEGRIIRNQRVWASKFLRRGVPVSGLGDFIRAIDPTVQFHTIGEAGALIQKALDQKTIMRGKVVWEAFDRDYYLDQGGATMEAKSPEQKQLRKQSTIRGMSKFDKAADGSYLAQVDGPSGNKIDAQAIIDKFYSA